MRMNPKGLPERDRYKLYANLPPEK